MTRSDHHVGDAFNELAAFHLKEILGKLMLTVTSSRIITKCNSSMFLFLQIIFEGAVGIDFKSDIAVDDIFFKDSKCGILFVLLVLYPSN